MAFNFLEKFRNKWSIDWVVQHPVQNRSSNVNTGVLQGTKKNVIYDQGAILNWALQDFHFYQARNISYLSLSEFYWLKIKIVFSQHVFSK